MSRYNCSFSYYYKDQKMADVAITNGTAATTPYTDDKRRLPFGFVSDRNVTRQTIDLFYERHCVPYHRANIQEFLSYYGLEQYDTYAICRKTNGIMADHDYRIEWKD